MKLERLLQINMALLATLGSFLLGVGQQSLQLPSMAVFAAVMSVLFTDKLKWFRLNRFIANLFAVLAALYSMHGFFQHQSQEQLLAVANLLIYLQFILLFQEKSERVYWQLMVLSLLQVVVAAALNMEFSSAILLVLYTLTAISALMLFFVHREFSRFQIASNSTPPQRAAALSGSRPNGRRLVAAPVALFSLPPDALGRQALHWTFLRQIGSIGLTTLAFTFILFYAIPRRNEPVWDGPPNAHRQDSGFGDTIDLDRSGRIPQSTKPVMRVSFRSDETGELVLAPYNPYFRAIVFSRYSVADRRWSPMFVGRQGGRPLGDAHLSQGLVRQEIVLHTFSDGTLPAAFPVYRSAETADEIRYSHSQDRLVLNLPVELLPPRKVRYSLTTDALQNNWQSPVIPARPPRYEELHQLLYAPFDELRELSNQIVAARNIDGSNPAAVAAALEDYLATTGGFTYSLVYTRTNRELDPIVDFVLNHRSGHCEFFASALCLMLRSQGIPARIAVGFKGGDYNGVGDYFQVRQKHAHAWVEAYFARDDIRPSMLAANQQISSGGWVRFDATPLSTQSDPGESSVMRRVDQFLNYFHFLWDDYVLGLDASQQKESIYDPLNEQTPDAMSPRGLMILLGDFVRRLREQIQSTGWLIVAFSIVGCIVCVVSYEFIVRRFKRLERWRLMPLLRRLLHRIVPGLIRDDDSDKIASARRRVEFYERLSRLLAAHGLIRAAGQTQREFAAVACQHLSHAENTGAVAPLPKSIVELFYRVRFGAAVLNDREALQVEQTLRRLEEALAITKTS